MTHRIQAFFFQGAPLPVPHFFGFPPFTKERTYDLIVPNDFSLSEGDTIVKTSLNNIIGPEYVVHKIVSRRPAKGDWSKQQVHKNPHYIRFIAQ